MLENYAQINDEALDTFRNGAKRSTETFAVMMIALAIVGIVFLARGEKSWPLYCVLFGFAGILFVAGAGILPTPFKYLSRS